jgi:hypothetical protein
VERCLVVIRLYDAAGNVIEAHVPQPERCAADTAVMPQCFFECFFCFFDLAAFFPQLD